MAEFTSNRNKSLMHPSEIEVEEESEQELTQFQLLVLTCTLGGLQVVWSILNGNINVFLLSIGIPASISPLIWVIAPICGTIIQPLVGWLSDRHQSRFGRRKPFVLMGALATSATLIGLSWSQNFAVAMSSSSDRTAMTAMITVVWVILLNISIQPLQMGIRALVMDGCSKAQQPQANAWAGCASSVGNVTGYLVSFATATTSVHVFGFGHFKYLAVIASLCLMTTVAVNICFANAESDTTLSSNQNQFSIVTLFKHFRHSSLVSSRTRTINQIQFCAWMGWFPFLFYMTSFVTNLGRRGENVAVGKIRNQSGALAGFLYAVVSCCGALLIPQLLHRTKYASAEIKASSAAPIATLFGLPLERVWCIGQAFFGLLMSLTILAFNDIAGIVLIAVAGIPWALANYIPFALLGVEVAEQRSLQRSSSIVLATVGHNSDQEEEEENEEEQLAFGTGATIGLHNAAISAPQIVAALISAGVLAISSRMGIQDGVGWIMRLSGIAALVAAWQIRKLSD